MTTTRRHFKLALVGSDQMGRGLRSGCVALLLGPLSLSAVGCAPDPAGQPSPAVSTYSSEQVMDEYWDSIASSYPDAQRPDVNVIRKTTATELTTVLESCMHDSGWPDVKATADGGLDSGSIPAGQDQAYAISLYTCRASYPLEDRFLNPFSSAQINTQYDYLVNEAVPCLERLGYSISPPSSREEFEDRFFSGGGWDPFQQVGEVVNSETGWLEVVTKCPQMPDSLLQ